MLCISSTIERRRLDEDWVETGEIRPSADGDHVDLDGVSIVARLVRLIDPDVEIFRGSTETGLIDFGDLKDDGAVPLVLRLPAAQVATELHSDDYRFDLIVTRDGLTEAWASGTRRFRN